eukprot:TRINITY_DN12432_c0_g1_i1.p1 TRINITY_DN12432_c0_g1~~TRINITY_DN12432_c0_g1_i1.p1  ORF type:complete len:374 (-),score=47.94 TRINITY_DN12432_c0_g1_i1:428-1549(-)
MSRYLVLQTLKASSLLQQSIKYGGSSVQKRTLCKGPSSVEPISIIKHDEDSIPNDFDTFKEFRISRWDVDGEKKFFESLASHLGMNEKNDWYRMTKEHVAEFGGERMLRKLYHGSVALALQDVYPDHKWLPWKFADRMIKGMWDNQKLQREFIHYLAQQLKIKEMEDWYGLSHTQIDQHGGAGLLERFDNSSSLMITTMFPKHEWDLENFVYKPTGKWDDVQFQRSFLDYLGKQLEIKEMDQWYKVNKTQICEKGGRGLLRRCNWSPSKMITSVLTEHEWNLHKFSSRPRRMLHDIKSQRDFLDQKAKELKIMKMEDWYNITRAQFCEKGVGGLLSSYHNSRSKMITCIFTDHDWDIESFSQPQKKRSPKKKR